MNQTTEIEEFTRVVESLIHNGKQSDRRSADRHHRSISLRVEPLDEDFRSISEPFWAISRDISKRGLAFINAETIDATYLRIGLLDHDITIFGEVRHSTSIGDHYPLFLIGVQFITDEIPDLPD